MTEADIIQVERIANILRGMTMDVRVPEETRAILSGEAARLDVLAANHHDENGLTAIAEERRRQIDVEGYTSAHDDLHTTGELAGAGSAYAMSAAASLQVGKTGLIPDPPPFFRFEKDHWKPRSPLEDLTRAGALIAAQIDVLWRSDFHD